MHEKRSDRLRHVPESRLLFHCSGSSQHSISSYYKHINLYKAQRWVSNNCDPGAAVLGRKSKHINFQIPNLSSVFYKTSIAFLKKQSQLDFFSNYKDTRRNVTLSICLGLAIHFTLLANLMYFPFLVCTCDK